MTGVQTCALPIFYFEREREGEGGAERIPSRLRIVSTEPNVGLELTNREIMTLAEMKSRTD